MILLSWLSLLFTWSSLLTSWVRPATTSKLFQGYKKNLPIYSSSSSSPSSSSVCNDGEWGIRSLIVPELVENGTTESIVLDCIYCLNEGEDHRIVVKWFLNDDPQPIYQWIPERHSRHASKRLSGRINLNYSIDSTNPLNQYRAINIIKPTTDLSGDYSCVVMSPDNGDSKKAKMIVYAPPTKIEFNYTREVKEMPSALRKTRGDSKEDSPLNPSFEELLSSPSHSTYAPSSTGLLRCDIKGVYPMPEVSIYRIGDENGTNPWPVTVVDTRIEEEKHRHAYNVRKVSLINDATLIKKFGIQPSIFECLVTLQLPNKKVVKRQKIMYTPVVNTFQVKGGQHRLGTTFLITLLTVFSGKSVLTLLGWQ